MNTMQTLAALIFSVTLLAGPAWPAEKTPKKLTCCEAAAAKDKECPHKCCVTAHRAGKSCEKCNPGKEDLKLKERKKAKSPEKRGEASGRSNSRAPVSRDLP